MMNNSASKKDEYAGYLNGEPNMNDTFGLYHQFNDEKTPKYQTRITELHDFFRLTLSETINVTDLKELECDNEKVAKFRDLMPRMLNNCRELTQRKSYIPFDSEASESDERQKKFQLLHQHQIVLGFQEFCNGMTKLIIEEHVLKFFLKCDCSHDLISKHWTSFYNLFEYVLGALGPIISYVPVNYPMIRKELGFKDLTVFQYYHFKLFECIKSKLGKEFPTLVTASIHHYVRMFPITNIILEKEVPMLRIMSNCNFRVESLSPKDFYMKTLKDYFNKEPTLGLKLETFKNFKVLLTRNALLASLFLPEWVSDANDLFISHLLLNKKSISEYIEIGKDTYDEEKKRYFRTETYFSLLMFRNAFEARNMLKEFKGFCDDAISEKISSAYGLNRDVEKLFDEVVQLANVDHLKIYSDSIEYHLCDLLGSTSKAIEQYVKYFESHLFKLVKKVKTTMAELSRDNKMKYLYDNLPILRLKFVNLPTFPSFFERSIFRKTILQSDQNSAFIKDIIPVYKDCLMELFKERIITNMSQEEELRYRDQYQPYISQFFQPVEMIADLKIKYTSFLSFYENIEAAVNLGKKYNENDHSSFFPLVFDREKIPKVFQQTNGELEKDFILPQGMDSTWNTFLSNYHKDNKAQNSDSSKKDLYPMWNLHHCEVESSYIIPDGGCLLFELTLFQTCVLILFNDNDHLTLQSITERTKLAYKDLILILKSFLNYKILLRDSNNSYRINESFKPDLRKVKNGKLRVVLPRNTSMQTSNMGNGRSSSAHHEGSNSQWTQELLKACITRSVKGERDGLGYDRLFETVKQQIQGFSVGEFKDALAKLLRDKFVTKDESTDTYKY
ncbi:rtt101p [Saccharomyces arboricola H-6]|uniref:Rtt101p n=1 Tax=Saccharomyces arboricola (strain H-6 / AS 2.3317 / CBS 10644) TaxID=1160507 RepID=J8Q6C1_SACAR|nr:rtt101p [Saccharomyces arboricola H-6]